MSDPLEIPNHIRTAAGTVELFFKLNGIKEWALMGIQSRRSESAESALAATYATGNVLLCADCEINGPVNCLEHGKHTLTTDTTGKVLLTKDQWETHLELNRKLGLCVGALKGVQFQVDEGLRQRIQSVLDDCESADTKGTAP